MDFRRFGIVMLGLVSIAGSAKATISYQGSQVSFSGQAGTDGLAVSSLSTFSGALTTDGFVTGDEYLDPTTQIEFLAFNGSGSAAQSFNLSGGTLSVTNGNTIEIVLPAGVDFGFAFNVTTPSSPFLNLCEDITVAGCSGNAVVVPPASGFIGAISDIPTVTALTTIWLHPASGSPTITLQSFEVATLASSATPDGPTMLLIGGGLIVLHLLRRRRANVAN